MVRAIKRRLSYNPRLTANDLRSLVPGLDVVSRSHVNKVILKRCGLPSRVAVKKPLLTAATIRRRFDWAKAHRRCTVGDWNTVLWSDESHIELWTGGAGFHGRVRRSRREDRYKTKFLRPTVKHPPKLMAWGCFGNGKLGDLVILPQNMRMNTPLYRNILQRKLESSFRKTGTDLFMQDGARCHTSHAMMNWFRENDVDLLDWPPHSPDMNPIENLWREWKRLLYAEFDPPRNLAQLEANMKASWRILGRNTDLLTNLCESAQRRVRALYEAQGGATKY